MIIQIRYRYIFTISEKVHVLSENSQKIEDKKLSEWSRNNASRMQYSIEKDYQSHPKWQQLKQSRHLFDKQKWVATTRGKHIANREKSSRNKFNQCRKNAYKKYQQPKSTSFAFKDTYYILLCVVIPFMSDI